MCVQEVMSEQALVGASSPSHQSNGHHTALHRAARVGNSDSMAALIKGGCALDLQHKDGNTALHEVSWHGFSHCVELLVKARADVNIRNKAGNTALHLACQNAHARTARLLLLGGATPNTKNNVGDTCLHVAARYNNHTVVKLLLSSLCSVSERNQVGDMALHVAAALNHKRTVQLLLEAGTDGKIRNNAGKTALDKARDNNNKDVALLLARAPKMHCFMRGTTIRKRRERLKAKRRTQSVTRGDSSPNKSYSSPVEETTSSEKMKSRTAVKVDLDQQQKLQWPGHTSPYRQQKVPDTSPYRQQKVPDTSSPYRQQEVPDTSSPYRQQKVPDTSSPYRQQKVPDTSPHRQQKVPDTSPYRQQKVPDTSSPYRQQKVPDTSSPYRQQKVPDTSPYRQQKVPDTSSPYRQQKVPDTSPYRQQKVPHTSTSHDSHHMRRKVALQALNDDDLRKGKKYFHIEKDLLFDDEEDNTAVDGKTYQLYTLYRDKDGNIRQAPRKGCHCKPLVKKLEGQLKATQEEMRLHVLNVQEQVNTRLGQMDCRNRHQIKAVDMLHRDRAAAERKKLLHRMEQRIAQRRQDSLTVQQAARIEELKSWCMSQLKDMDVHVPAKAQYYKLLPSPSVELETFPLLSMVSGESSASLATYVNILPSTSSHSLGSPEQPRMGTGTYFDMRVNRSPDDYENTLLFPLPAPNPSGLALGPVEPTLEQNGAVAPLVCPCGGGFSSSSSSSLSSSNQQQSRQFPHQEHIQNNRQYRACFEELRRAQKHAGIHAEATRTLQVFIEQHTEPTERNYLHAKEVTQRFFDTVSVQLERWYERKIQELEQKTQLRVQQDRETLLLRVSELEEELHRLRASEHTQSWEANGEDTSNLQL